MDGFLNTCLHPMLRRIVHPERAQKHSDKLKWREDRGFAWDMLSAVLRPPLRPVVLAKYLRTDEAEDCQSLLAMYISERVARPSRMYCEDICRDGHRHGGDHPDPNNEKCYGNGWSASNNSKSLPWWPVVQLLQAFYGLETAGGLLQRGNQASNGGRGEGRPTTNATNRRGPTPSRQA